MVEQDPEYIQDVCKSAEMDRQTLGDLVCEEGVTGFDALRVTESSPAGLSVTVSTGGAFIDNDQDTADGEGGTYHVYNAGDVVLNISANNSGSTRTDTVWARVCDSQYAAVTSDFDLVVVEGNTVAPADGCTYYKLATVTVPDSAVAVNGNPASFGASDGQITDERNAYSPCGTGGALQQELVYAASGTFDKSDFPSMKSIRVRVVGGGGGGGSAGTPGSGNVSVGGGGGGGGYAERVFRADELPSGAIPVTVGGGGATAVGSTGGTGQTSSFNGVTGAGGVGGASAGTGGTNQTALGGAGGAGTGGDFGVTGGVGHDSWGSAVTGATRGVIGGGGRTPLSNGSSDAVVGSSTGGGVGQQYGGGGTGSAAVSPQAGTAAGVGASGIVIIELYG